MALPDFTMRQLLEAGAHFGHQSHRWNPKMAPYIYGSRNSIHIIDLAQTVPLLHQALKAVSDTVSKGGRVLFVGTKRQASDEIAGAAKRSAQYFVNARWLGGMLTNWKTISASISRLRKLDEMLSEGAQGLTKKERLMLSREREKLETALGGIKDMGGVPDLVFVIDTNKEALAIKEANRLKIPVIAILDTNSDPDGIAYPVPANDDAGRAIQLYCDLVARAAIDGIWRSQGAHGVDLGEAETPVAEPLPETIEPETASTTDRFELLSAPRGAPDDLAKLTGVGPQIVKKLNEHGVFHYWQLAAMTPEEAAKLDADLKFNGRIARDKWSDQARALMAGRIAPRERCSLTTWSRRRRRWRRGQTRNAMADDHRGAGQGSAREDRRGHDGLQESRSARRTATSKPRSTGCARRASPRRPRRAAASLPRALSASRSKTMSALSSRSIPRPISSPATTTSRRWCAACWRSRSTRAPVVDVETVLGAHYMGGGTVSRGDRQRHRHHRREHDVAPRRRACRCREGAIGHYVHSQIVDGLGRIGVIVGLEFEGEPRCARRRSAGRSRCMSPPPGRSR